MTTFAQAAAARAAIRKTAATKLVTRPRPCYCISLFKDHMAGAPGCGYNPDFTDRN